MRARRGMGGITIAAVMGIMAAALLPAAAGAAEDILVARVSDASGNTIGTVRFVADDGKVLVKTSLKGLSAGFHGFHVHAIGTCNPANSFVSAGGHYNPTAAVHGGHAGDMPPLLVTSDGTNAARFYTDRFSVQQLLDPDGSAVIVHAGPDNLGHVPATTASAAERYHSHVDFVFGPDAATRATGDAGSRTGCGVIQRVND